MSGDGAANFTKITGSSAGFLIIRCKGFSGAGVLEVIEDHAGDTYRAIYTVQLEGAVYVLHAFRKKSKSGIKTPKKELDLVRDRLRRAEIEHAKR